MTDTSDARDEYYVESAQLRSFIAEVRHIIAAEPDRARAVQALRPAFSALLVDKGWLPETFQQPSQASGMGSGISQYLLYRSAEHDLTLSSLVLSTGTMTPVHDHLAWGLVGLYRGEQEEWVYRRVDAGSDEGTAILDEVEKRHLRAGDFYDLLPPDGDIHGVHAMDDGPSVSLHLLGNDVGCVWRHRYQPREHAIQPFRSGYSNQPCPDTEASSQTAR
jgi:predicted metal-dependent enzyme (double-stranded beta helix superfamily)